MNILIVLAGTPPSKTLLKTEIKRSDLVLAVDGGFNVFQKYKLQPDLVLGDMDSADLQPDHDVKMISLPDQDLTDLQKTLQYVFKSHLVTSLMFLGASGERSDHFLNNLHLCASIDHSIKIVFKNEIPHSKDFTLEIIERITSLSDFDQTVKKGTTLSILPISNFLGLTTEGLKWEIKGCDYSNRFISQSNMSIKDDPRFTIRSGYAYIAVYQ
jgi:thiamine pyrophosphokinase